MKLGDLVKLLDDPEVRRNNGEIPPDSICIVVEEPSTACFQKGGALESMWVQWNGRWDWDARVVEDLEVISASR